MKFNPRDNVKMIVDKPDYGLKIGDIGIVEGKHPNINDMPPGLPEEYVVHFRRNEDPFVVNENEIARC